MKKFTKGMSYIFNGKLRIKYIVHQTGLKSWRATVFSHVMVDSLEWNFVVLEGNATSLFERLIEVTNSEEDGYEVRAYNTNESLRKDMFNILKFGKFEE